MTDLELFLTMPDVTDVTDTVTIKLNDKELDFVVKPITTEQFT